jgi:hypothetical protein
MIFHFSICFYTCKLQSFALKPHDWVLISDFFFVCIDSRYNNIFVVWFDVCIFFLTDISYFLCGLCV